MGKCSLCSGENIVLRHPHVRDNKELHVLECQDCGLVFLNTFNHISEQFYEDSGMLSNDISFKQYRQQSFKDDQRRANQLKEKIRGKTVLDFGCGAGGFLNLIKENTSTVAGVELDKELNQQINSENIRCYSNIAEIKGEYDFITLFHVLEHIVDPGNLLNELKQYLKPNGTMIIEVPNADDALLTLYENNKFADFTYWSCHVFLYNSYTLKRVVEEAGYKVNFIKQYQRYPLSNHLYWLSHGKPNGHNMWNPLNDFSLNDEYEKVLASLGKCDTLILECNTKS